MKKVFTLLLLTFLCCIFFQLNVEGHSGKFGSNISWVLDENGTLTLTGTGEMSTDWVPWRADTYYELIKEVIVKPGITSISDSAFFDCHNMQAVSLPKGLKVIDKQAFCRCSSLESISIPEEVTVIGECAFQGCSSLTTVHIPEGVKEIGDFTFDRCTALTDVELPATLTRIGEQMFYNCRLSSVNIPDGVTYIGKHAFDGCTFSSIVIPENVETIDWFAFANCKNLTRIYLPEGLVSLCEGAFWGSGLTSISLPGGLAGISESLFCNCHDLRSVSIPEGIEAIAHQAFYECDSLMSITIPEGVTSIDETAFYGCSGLKNIEFPDSIKTIEISAFTGCNSVKNIVVWGRKTNLNNVSFSSAPTVYCYEYSDADFWASEKNYKIVYLDNMNIDGIRQITLTGPSKIIIDESDKIECDVFPNNDNPSITWSSSDPSILSVSDGMITAKRPGTATITATVGPISSNKTITACYEVEDFHLNEIWVVSKESRNITISGIKPIGAIPIITWISNDESIATIDKTGIITGHKIGDVEIRAIEDNGIVKITTAHVCYPVTDISFEPLQELVYPGNRIQMTANVIMRDQSCVNQLVDFSSSDTNIATIDETGMLQAFHPGQVTITARSSKGVEGSCQVFINYEHTLELPAELRIIEKDALSELDSIEAVRIPDTVYSIENNAFDGSDVIIVAPTDSYAIEWAKSHSRPYIEE